MGLLSFQELADAESYMSCYPARDDDASIDNDASPPEVIQHGVDSAQPQYFTLGSTCDDTSLSDRLRAIERIMPPIEEWLQEPEYAATAMLNVWVRGTQFPPLDWRAVPPQTHRTVTQSYLNLPALPWNDSQLPNYNVRDIIIRHHYTPITPLNDLLYAHHST